jgi:hypothetical protein
MKRLAILIIHGIGVTKKNFQKPMVDALHKLLTEDERKHLVIEPCLWDPVTAGTQEYIYHKLVPKFRVCYKDLHHFTIDALGDPVSYLSSFEKEKNEPSFYQGIHDCVFESLRNLEKRLGEDAKDTPLMILAHSLGSVIITNYRWDCEAGHYQPKTSIEPRTPMEKMENLTSFITYGSNIPLFISVDPTKGEDVVSIQFPPNESVEKNKARANWDNIFSPSDILGWQLSNIWTKDHGPKKPINDIMMSVGPVWKFWRRYTPLTHLDYMTDRRVLKLIVKRIRELI